MVSRCTMKVAGKEVPLNEFLEGFLVKVMRAVVGSLKGTDPAGEIEIRVWEE
jgi:hypothetical protein